MRTSIPRVLTLALLLSAVGASLAQAAGEGWTSDAAAALKQAKAEKKDVILEFTGSDWCPPCMRLKKDVLSKEAFLTDAMKQFVLVEFDFPNDKSKLSEATQRQNDEWQQKLNVEGFPTLFLADAQGVPYAKTGFRPLGPKEYAAHLSELAGIRVKRDAAFAKAKTAKGLDRAKLLDEALEVVGEELAFQAYSDVVREIILLDADNKGGFKDAYQQRLNSIDFQAALTRASSGVDEKNAADRVKQIDDAVAKLSPDKQGRWMALNVKMNIWKAGGKAGEAVKAADALLAEKDLPAEAKLQITVQKASLLASDGKLPAAVAILDKLIAEQPADNPIRVQLMVAKAQLMAEAGDVKGAGKAMDEAINSVDEKELKERLKEIKTQILESAK